MGTLGTFITEEYVFYRCYQNRCLWIYKIARISYWVVVVVQLRGAGGGGVGGQRRSDVNFWTFTGGVVVAKIEQVQTKRQGGGGGVQVLIILWECNNWMPPYGEYLNFQEKSRSKSKSPGEKSKSPGEMCMLVQEVLLIALALSSKSSFEFYCEQNFVALYNCFCKSTSFCTADLVVLLKWDSVLQKVFLYSKE